MRADGRFGGTPSGGGDPDGRQNSLQRIEQSKVFQFTVIGVILANTMLMACEANAVKPVPIFTTLDMAFLIFFMSEISFRLLAYRWSFFTNKRDKGWNIFDFTIVLVGCVDAFIVTPMFKDTGKTPKFLMVFRVLRILRVLRAFRLFKQFKKLKILALGLVSSLQSVVWVAVLFALVMFVYAIIITSLAGKNWAKFESEEDQEIVRDKFGTIMDSMETLFLFLTCDDWSTPARAVNKRYPGMEIVWVTYIVIGAFTLLSLLTGLMADKMNQVRTQEEEKEAKQKVAELDDFIMDLKQIFDKADTSGDANVNVDEFKQMVCEKNIAEQMQQWGVPVMKKSEAEEIFNALDRSQDGELSWDEFRDGLVQLSKPFTSKDIMWLEGSIFKLDRTLRQKQEGNPGLAWDHKLNKVHARASLISERLEILERDLDEFFHSVGYRPPDE